MKFENADQVKKWFRTLPLYKKELHEKVNFYTGLIDTFTRVGIADEQAAQLFGNTYGGTYRDKYKEKISDIDFYRKQIEKCRKKYNEAIEDWEELSKYLNSDEITVITAKYFKGVSWDGMEFVVYFSRRQCFRIVDKAAKKLVGKTVRYGTYD